MLCRTSLRNPLRLIGFARIVRRFETERGSPPILTHSFPSRYCFAQYLDCARIKIFPACSRENLGDKYINGVSRRFSHKILFNHR